MGGAGRGWSPLKCSMPHPLVYAWMIHFHSVESFCFHSFCHLCQVEVGIKTSISQDICTIRLAGRHESSNLLGGARLCALLLTPPATLLTPTCIK